MTLPLAPLVGNATTILAMDAAGSVDDCPICLEPFDRSRRKRVTWECGHGVCASCDSDMAANGLHMCPTCRTPRRGMTREEATHHAERARLRDAQEEAGYHNHNHTHYGDDFRPIPFLHETEEGRLHLQRRRYTSLLGPPVSLPPQPPSQNLVMFFPNQAEGGGPADILQDMERQVRAVGSGRPPDSVEVDEDDDDVDEHTPRDGLHALALLLTGFAGAHRAPGAVLPALERRAPRTFVRRREQEHERARPRPRPRPRGGP